MVDCSVLDFPAGGRVMTPQSPDKVDDALLNTHDCFLCSSHTHYTSCLKQRNALCCSSQASGTGSFKANRVVVVVFVGDGEGDSLWLQRDVEQKQCEQ